MEEMGGGEQCSRVLETRKMNQKVTLKEFIKQLTIKFEMTITCNNLVYSSTDFAASLTVHTITRTAHCHPRTYAIPSH